MVKKKVSFDIDQQLLESIKEICRSKGIKLADFFREASQEKINNEKSYISIYVPANGKIEHLQINRNDFEIDLFEASHQMKVNVGAECEGVLRTKKESYENIDPFIKQLFKDTGSTGKLRFYTKMKYLDCRKPNAI